MTHQTSIARTLSRALLGLALAAAAPTIALGQATAIMSGNVTGHDGTPAVGVVVRLEPKDDHGTRVEAKSNKKGRYLIGMVRSGAYTLHVVATSDAILLHMKGKGIDTDDGSVLWEADQDVTGSPDISIGARNKIELDIVVGPASETAEAKQVAAGKAMTEGYDAAVAKVKAQDWEGALALLGPLAEKKPDFPNTWYLIAYSDQQLGKWDEAIAAVDKTLAIDPAFAGAHLLRGRALKGKGSMPEAEAELRKEIEANGDRGTTADAWASLGVIHEQAKKLPEAASDLEKVLEIDPSRTEVIYELAKIYSDLGDRSKAAATLERGEKAGGMDQTMLLNLAISAINEKKYDEAAGLANKLLAKDSATKPNLSMAHSILARCELNRGNMAAGKEHLEKAIELDPESKTSKENREILNSLKGVK